MNTNLLPYIDPPLASIAARIAQVVERASFRYSSFRSRKELGLIWYTKESVLQVPNNSQQYKWWVTTFTTATDFLYSSFAS